MNYDKLTKAQLIALLKERDQPTTAAEPRRPKPGEVWLDGGDDEHAVLEDDGSTSAPFYCLEMVESGEVIGLEWRSQGFLTRYLRDFDLTFGAREECPKEDDTPNFAQRIDALPEIEGDDGREYVPFADAHLLAVEADATIAALRNELEQTKQDHAACDDHIENLQDDLAAARQRIAELAFSAWKQGYGLGHHHTVESVYCDHPDEQCELFEEWFAEETDR